MMNKVRKSNFRLRQEKLWMTDYRYLFGMILTFVLQMRQKFEEQCIGKPQAGIW